MNRPLKIQKTHIKLIASHERTNDLFALLLTYDNVYARMPEDIARPAEAAILDSSAKPAGEQTRRLAKHLGFEYIHIPAKNIGDKITHYATRNDKVGISGGKDVYIDLCTDQDPTFYPARQEETGAYTGHPAIVNCPTIGWIKITPKQNDKRLEESKPQVLLRSQGSTAAARRYINRRDAIMAAKVKCMLPNPNQFWGCIRSDIFMIRSRLISLIGSNVSPDQHKIIECFLNVFHSFATQSSESSALRLRASDDRASLRETRADMSSLRTSFATIYHQLRENQKDIYLRCLGFLRNALGDLAAADASIIPVEPESGEMNNAFDFVSLELLDKLMQYTVASYGKALEYDLHMELYLYAHYAQSYEALGWPIERVLPGGGHPGPYAFWRNSPILVTPKTDALAISLISSNLMLANEIRLNILKSIPCIYWSEVQRLSRLPS